MKLIDIAIKGLLHPVMGCRANRHLESITLLDADSQNID